jgi:hypothetical protein
VERRQASAPAAEGRRKPALRGAPRTRWCGHETLRLSAFRFLRFLSSVLLSFVIASQRVRPEVAGPTTSSAKQSSATAPQHSRARLSRGGAGSLRRFAPRNDEERARRCLTFESEGSRCAHFILSRWRGGG